MEYNPELAHTAARDLDALADRLSAALRDDGPLLRTEPAGGDEVSVQAAQTLCRVGDSYNEAADLVVYELRKLAAVVRAQTTAILEMDLHASGHFGSGVEVTG
ncbi:PE family protein [Nocardia carnea]|uniref:PE family protein n=1 Tax=Nocardia carnea TaxID=37328 RepID=UPI0024565344|nr:PE family protein [Nocardia carnea]